MYFEGDIADKDSNFASFYETFKDIIKHKRSLRFLVRYFTYSSKTEWHKLKVFYIVFEIILCRKVMITERFSKEEVVELLVF